jgi:hypothetical protein
MTKVTKRYTIKFSKGGIIQYADFSEADGVLVNPRLHISWTSVDEVPDVSNMTKIDEVLEAIKSVAYCNRAEIYLINGAPVFYFNKKRPRKHILMMGDAFEVFIDSQITTFFNNILLPIIKRNNWNIGRSHVGYYVLIKQNKKGGWDNVQDSKALFEFEYLCAKALHSLNIIEKINITNESNNFLFESYKLFNRVNDIEKCGFYLEI